MERFKTIDTLKKWDQSSLNGLISSLNTDHIVSDEDGIGLSSIMVEDWSEECDDYLRSRGYVGGEIQTHGAYFSHHGAVYVIYDEDHVTYEEASEYIVNIGDKDSLQRPCR